MIKQKIYKAYSEAVIIIGFFFIILIPHNINASDNYIVTLVNNLPITKVDVVNRSKLLYYSIKNDNNFKGLNNFYSKSLQTLINEKIMISAGLKSNKNIQSIVKNKVFKIVLSNFKNSEENLNKFAKKLSISRKTIIEKYESELIWAIVLKNNFKQEIRNIDDEVRIIINQKELQKNKDKYDLAEIIIEKKNNLILLEKILDVLNKGADFLEIAKQTSISTSKYSGGKIGWKTLEELPNEITSKASNININDIFNYETKDTFNIIKILSKRINGKISPYEDKVILAEIKFKINFGDKNNIYSKIKDKISLNLINKKTCNSLKLLRRNKDITLKVVKSRIADLNIRIQKRLNNLKLFGIMDPLYIGNNGYIFVLCDVEKAKNEDFDPNLTKNKLLDKRFKVLSAKLLKKLTQNAAIINKNELK